MDIVANHAADSKVGVSTRTCITGGSLHAFSEWYPREITEIHGMKFVALHMNEYMLHAFCGARGPNESPLKKSNFLDHLRPVIVL